MNDHGRKDAPYSDVGAAGPIDYPGTGEQAEMLMERITEWYEKSHITKTLVLEQYEVGLLLWLIEELQPDDTRAYHMEPVLLPEALAELNPLTHDWQRPDPLADEMVCARCDKSSLTVFVDEDEACPGVAEPRYTPDPRD